MMDPACLDAADPLASFREQFHLPEGTIYLDGNSLGPLPKATQERMTEVIDSEWGEGLISSWNAADWINAPRRIGDKIATIIGANHGEVIACDSTSVNIFKALAAALDCNPDRGIILSEGGNFPTDLYMGQGLARLSPRAEMRVVDYDDLESAIDESVAVVLVTQVHYKTGRMRDMAAFTAKAHAAGALVVWDLSHSTGAVPLDLDGAGADFAIGCGYKYLNGGPGAPAFIYAAKRHHAAIEPILSGWFGHRAPFAFTDEYEAAGGIEQFLAGTPPILGLAALECGVDLMLEADMADIRAKSLSLSRLFMERMEPLADRHGFELVSPRKDEERGSQVSYRHEHAYPICQAMIARDVIGDFRAPDIWRCGFTPLYLSHADVARAVDILNDVMESGAWDAPEFHQRNAVT
ncbi:kynureninase [Pseudoblastomonas halimionae]|uniref:Kynureninase n=1 Tax=Alteriqipengyuania halimionae TaxID=1926630 RepID=A0A6I4U2Z7_9SPHN|nr:kynureninase [Alteriqipengyuania halimionae]MXP10308.1 kynureninase [Alteriqipengyuania halimionae]